MTPTQKHIAGMFGTQLPFLPVCEREEFSLFNRQMQQGTGCTHDTAFYEAWAVEWVTHVSPDKGVWPKLPGHLRHHHAMAKRNESKRSATVRVHAFRHATCTLFDHLFTHTPLPQAKILKNSQALARLNAKLLSPLPVGIGQHPDPPRHLPFG